MTINKTWFWLCIVWAALGGVILYFTDGSSAEGAVWLIAGVVVGCLDGLFVERFVEMIQVGLECCRDRCSPTLAVSGFCHEVNLSATEIAVPDRWSSLFGWI